MQVETKKCQNCKGDFTIEPEDFNFYEKIKVPAPTWCPECRLVSRLINISERTFYKDICDNCGKEMVSIFAPSTPYKVYCEQCWWGDSWDGTQYGRNYDPSKTFFEQYHELRKVVPCQAVNIENSTDCKYCMGINRCKNCTHVFSGLQSINCYYCLTPVFTKDSIDCDFVFNADHVYEVLSANRIYNVKFNYFSDDCMDCSFVFDCRDCQYCFGCINLRHKKYCILNKQYSKEEYQKEIKKWDLGSYEIQQKAKEEFLRLYYKTPRRFSILVNTVNVTGDNMANAKNCKYCFSVTGGVENCKYIFQGGLLLKDSYDFTLGGAGAELLYGTTGSTKLSKALFSRACNNSVNIEYCENVFDCQNCFGCAKLRHKKYCILNKQYTEEEYYKTVEKIKKHMDDMPYFDKKGIIYKYGDYYPFEHAMWAYNESWAHEWFPLKKEEALSKGFYWRDREDRNYKITLKNKDLPGHIKDVTDSILDEVIECEHYGKDCNQQCTEAFKILPNELNFYRQMNLALPRFCPNCRHYERFKMGNPPKLWHRKCMCNGIESNNEKYQNTIKHFHGDKPCIGEFETAISPDRKEIVYCKECYQSEFI